MASASVSELVLFIAALSVAAAVAGTMVTTVGGIAASLDDHGADVAAQIDTDVEIISDPASGAMYDADANTVRVLVKNTGERPLATDGTSVELLVDGRYVPRDDYAATVLDGSEWRDGAVVRILANDSLAAGDHTVTVVVTGDRDTERFHT